MYKQMEVAGVKEQQATGCNRLKSKWVLWAHFPHDTDWSVASYKKVAEFETVESVIAVTQSLPEKLVKNCMLFLMKEGIQPIWEDPMNRDGVFITPTDGISTTQIVARAPWKTDI